MPTTRRLRARKLTPLQIVPASYPSFVALDPTQTHLYSVNEDTAGRVSAYAVNPANGNLTFINSASANGQFTTHISVHPSGQYVYAANYGTGNFPVYRILANGSIGPDDRRIPKRRQWHRA